MSVEKKLLIIFFIYIIVFIVPVFIEVIQKHRKTKSIISSDTLNIDQMSTFQFEIYLKLLFKNLGYRPQIIKQPHDFGANFILKGSSKIVIQARKFGYKNNVSLNPIREIYAAKAYYKADEAWVITNTFYTKQAKELAQSCGVKLMDRQDLQKFIMEIEK